MSKELLKQLKVGDKVWVEMELIETIDNDGDFEFIGNYHSGKYNAYLNHNNNFSLSNPNEQLKREFKVGDWVIWEGEDELSVKQGSSYKIAEVDKSIVTIETNDRPFSAYYTNFSLCNELTVRELCEFMEVNNILGELVIAGDGEGFVSISNSLNELSLELSLEELTEMVRNPNTQRKEEIKKQIEELQKELNSL
jgi:hypothetical protein